MNSPAQTPFDKIAVIIPAFNPEAGLYDLVLQLLSKGCASIVVVDDGSELTYSAVFDHLSTLKNVVVLRHAVNCGKGRALKTAFNWCMCHYPELKGVVTADADGQHSPLDVSRTAMELHQTGAFVLGSRDFPSSVPLRSRVGNLFTRWLMTFLLGRKIVDTQTGLRGIPANQLPRLVTLTGEGYEYETNMLVELISHRVEVRQLPIETIYIDGNRSSHFNPLLDSMRIYFVLIRFVGSSLLTATIDFIVFAITLSLVNGPLTALAVARLCALSFNFFTNKRFVFKAKGSSTLSLVRFCAVVVGMLGLSYLSIREIVAHTNIGTLGAKAIAESLLFLLSFSIQRVFVFPDVKKE